MAPEDLPAQAEMIEVTIEPLGEVIAVYPGETVMRAAQRSGLRWPTLCNGSALCGVCHMRLSAADVAPAAPAPKETEALKLVPPHYRHSQTRLACQLVPRGNMIVEKQGVRRLTPQTINEPAQGGEPR